MFFFAGACVPPFFSLSAARVCARARRSTFFFLSQRATPAKSDLALSQLASRRPFSWAYSGSRAKMLGFAGNRLHVCPLFDHKTFVLGRRWSTRMFFVCDFLGLWPSAYTHSRVIWRLSVTRRPL
nr:hypothetical protein [Pandoravirus massiliensis]